MDLGIRNIDRDGYRYEAELKRWEERRRVRAENERSKEAEKDKDREG